MRGTSEVGIDFSGGVNLQALPYLIADNQARDALNVHTSSQGNLKKRRGFVSIATPANTLTSLFPANVTVPKLLGAGSTFLYSITTGGTVTQLKSGLNSDLLWNWVQAPTSGGQGPIYGCNGTDTPQYWDGTSGSTSDWTASTGTVPVGKYLAYHGTRIWIAGVAATPGRLYYSGITGSAPDPRNWDTAGYVDLEPADGQAITGIGVCGPYLLVFKARKTYVVTDLVTGANRKLSDEVGCISHRSIVDSEHGCFFLSNDQGVMNTKGQSVDQVSDAVMPLIDQARVSTPQMTKAAGAYLDGNYYLSVSTNGTANNRILHYDTVTKSWWVHDQASNCFAILDPTATPQLYSADPSAARVHKAFVDNVFTDNGAAYAGGAYWISNNYVWGNPHISKRVREVRIDGQGTWLLQYAQNFTNTFTTADGEAWETPDDTGDTFGGGGTFGGSGTFGPTVGLSEWRYFTLGNGRAWAFKIVDNNAAADLNIYSTLVAVDSRTD